MCVHVCICMYVRMYITEICSCGLLTCSQLYVCHVIIVCVMYATRVFCIEYVRTYVCTRVLELCYERMYVHVLLCVDDSTNASQAGRIRC